MKIFKSSCVDTLTKLEIIASEVNYNHVCYFIETHYKIIDVHTTKDSLNHNITIFETPTKKLLYDESREILLTT